MNKSLLRIVQKLFQPVQGNLLIPARRLLIFMGVFIVIAEIIEHSIEDSLHFEPAFLAQLALFGIVVPLFSSAILGLLAQSEKERGRLTVDLDRQLTLVRHLGEADEWNELLKSVVEVPLAYWPARQISLFMNKTDNDPLELVALWQNESNCENLSQRMEPIPCKTCQEGSRTLHKLNDDAVSCCLYCLPLYLGKQQIGLIQMELPQGFVAEERSSKSLEGMSYEIAVALDRARLERSAVSQAEASLTDRRQIAQDLHDTLGQNIAYLRLKMDSLLIEQNPAREISAIQQELWRMRQIADEAYTQMRDTLADLRPEKIMSLATALLEHAQAAGERSGFQVTLSQQGSPGILRPTTRRQIIYIFREVINNVVKHSSASQVDIVLCWQEDELSVSLKDNGRGFDPSEVDTQKHYGLTIIQERAEAIRGVLNIVSAPGQGTVITLRVPLSFASRELQISTTPIDLSRVSIFTEKTTPTND